MKEILQISSLENETLKRLCKLKKKKYREEEKLFLAEGRKFLDYLEDVVYLILREDVLFEEKDFPKDDCTVLRLSRRCFEKLSSQENSQGIILVYSRKEPDFKKIGKQILVLDDIQDPGNLGTILRLADASGFQDVLLTAGSVDVYNEKTVRSSMGSIFHIRNYTMEKEEMLNFLKQKKYHCIVTSLQEDSIPYTEMDLEEKNAFIFGNEGHGVSPEFLDFAAQKVIIPISGKAESLNVAMALGIIAFYLRDLKRIWK